MIRSMTGFGAAAGAVGRARERRAAHRQPPLLQSEHQAPGRAARWEGEVREALRRAIARGHVTLVARIEREDRAAPIGTSSGSPSTSRSCGACSACTGSRRARPCDGAADARTSCAATAVARREGRLEELVAVVRQAAAALDGDAGGGRRTVARGPRRADRDRGAALERIAARAPERHCRRAGATASGRARADEGATSTSSGWRRRSRSSPTGWMWRRRSTGFESHISAFREALQRADAEPVGKRLGFLLQEMLREANTTGSKANDAAMPHDVVTVKEELERIREQVENLE